MPVDVCLSVFQWLKSVYGDDAFVDFLCGCETVAVKLVILDHRYNACKLQKYGYCVGLDLTCR